MNGKFEEKKQIFNNLKFLDEKIEYYSNKNNILFIYHLEIKK